MYITPELGDAAAFIELVATLTSGVLHRHAPQALVLIKVNSWFGVKWLGFFGRPIPHVALWRNTTTVPPFTPSRIVAQRRFAAPDYREVPFGSPIHLRVRSKVAITRTLAEIEPETAFIWYSGNSEAAKRASLMAYIPVEGCYRCWYSAWSAQAEWRVEKTKHLSRRELQALIES